MENPNDLDGVILSNTSNADVIPVGTTTDAAPISTAMPASTSSTVPTFDFNVPYILPPVELAKVPAKVLEEVEANYYCPITQELLFEPTQTPMGILYEREKILEHLTATPQTSSETSGPSAQPSKNCPMSGTPLKTEDLVAIARPLLNMYRQRLQYHPQLWHDVYIAKSYQQALYAACFDEKTVNLEFHVRKHALALTHVTVPDGRLLIEALCEPQAKTSELLPWITSQLKPEQWQDLVRQRSVQHWLQTIANVVFHAETAAVGFVKALALNLNLSFKPQAFLDYALSSGHRGLTHLALARYPKLMTSVDADGNTLLHRAIGAENVLLAQVLLERGCNTQVKNHEGKKPAQLINQHQPLTDLLAKHEFMQSFNSLGSEQQDMVRN